MLGHNPKATEPPKCDYFYSAFLQKSILVNSGYNCSHPYQNEIVEVQGQQIGCCYCWSCPLCEKKYEDGFKSKLDFY